MIEMSTEAQSVVTGSYTIRARASAWLDGELVADEVPIATGQEEVDVSLAVPERVSVSVPRVVDGFTWAPIDIGHPLASSGQRLRVEIGVELGNNRIEWLPRGEFLIYDVDPQGDSVVVEVVGLLELVREARLVSPYQPTGTFVSTLRGLVEPALTADFTGLTDRAVPPSMAFEEERLGALNELLDAWPAEAMVDEFGVLQVQPQGNAASVLDLTDGVGGTVVRTRGGTTRSGAATVVVARGQAADGTQVQGVVYDMDGSSALRYGGPFNPLPVPYFFFSPLLTTAAMCRKAATTILARLRRTSARAFTITMVPHPGLQGGDVVTVTSAENGLDAVPCVVDALTLPYSADRGAMTLGVRVA